MLMAMYTPEKKSKQSDSLIATALSRAAYVESQEISSHALIVQETRSRSFIMV